MNTSDDTAHQTQRLGTLLGVVALGTLVGWSLHAVNRVHRRRLADPQPTVTASLQTWEGEGGRATAADTPEITPDPAPDPAT